VSIGAGRGSSLSPDRFAAVWLPAFSSYRRRKAATMFRRRRFSPAVQDLFGGDGMIEDSGSVGFNELERILRNMLTNLSAHFGGDENRARLILLDGLPRHRRRIFEALLTQPRGRPRGDAGRASNKEDLVLLAVYNFKKAEDPTIGPWEFARWWHDEMGQCRSVTVDTVYRRLTTVLRK
jgi:hypothetical protein